MLLLLEKYGHFLAMTWVFLIAVLLPVGSEGMEKQFTNSFGMEFVLVSPGTFFMGSPPEEPSRESTEVLHRVTITKPIYMMVHEVTNRHWRAVMGKSFFGRRGKKLDHPVVKVSWHDCTRFIERLNENGKNFHRLPTEAEWEYSCRAGSEEAYAWGQEIDCTRAMYGNSHKINECKEYAKKMGVKKEGPVPVKSYPPNRWGLYDMHGNVWEWCEDWYAPYPVEAEVDPQGPDSGEYRIRRGGSWFSPGKNCRSANRANAHPGSKFQNSGFRLIMEVP